MITFKVQDKVFHVPQEIIMAKSMSFLRGMVEYSTETEYKIDHISPDQFSDVLQSYYTEQDRIRMYKHSDPNALGAVWLTQMYPVLIEKMNRCCDLVFTNAMELARLQHSLTLFCHVKQYEPRFTPSGITKQVDPINLALQKEGFYEYFYKYGFSSWLQSFIQKRYALDSFIEVLRDTSHCDTDLPEFRTFGLNTGCHYVVMTFYPMGR